MSVTLEPFSALKSPLQARLAVPLVERSIGVLSLLNPGAIERYRDYPHAVKNISRVALADNLEAYFIKDHLKARVVRGIATIIRNHTVIHPDGTVLSGNDLEYWLDGDATDELHDETGKTLIEQSGQLQARNDKSARVLHRAFAAIPPENIPYVRGLVLNMERIGSPAEILVEPSDQYGIGKDGRPVQLYSHEALVQIRA